MVYSVLHIRKLFESFLIFTLKRKGSFREIQGYDEIDVAHKGCVTSPGFSLDKVHKES